MHKDLETQIEKLDNQIYELEKEWIKRHYNRLRTAYGLSKSQLDYAISD